MRLTGAGGQACELRLLGYQFRDLADDEFDSNWLVVQVEVTHPRGSWTATHPCLETHDLEKLAGWLMAVAEGSNTKDICSFTEPCLVFAVEEHDGSRLLRIYFDHELRPQRGSGSMKRWSLERALDE